jgi:hypothetical protein
MELLIFVFFFFDLIKYSGNEYTKNNGNPTFRNASECNFNINTRISLRQKPGYFAPRASALSALFSHAYNTFHMWVGYIKWGGFTEQYEDNSVSSLASYVWELFSLCIVT